MLYLIAVILGVIRILGAKTALFQALAHLFVGYLFGAAYYQYQYTWKTGGNSAMNKLWLAVVLSLLELVCFLAFKILA